MIQPINELFDLHLHKIGGCQKTIWIMLALFNSVFVYAETERDGESVQSTHKLTIAIENDRRQRLQISLLEYAIAYQQAVNTVYTLSDDKLGVGETVFENINLLADQTQRQLEQVIASIAQTSAEKLITHWQVVGKLTQESIVASYQIGYIEAVPILNIFNALNAMNQILEKSLVYDPAVLPEPESQLDKMAFRHTIMRLLGLNIVYIGRYAALSQFHFNVQTDQTYQTSLQALSTFIQQLDQNEVDDRQRQSIKLIKSRWQILQPLYARRPDEPIYGTTEGAQAFVVSYYSDQIRNHLNKLIDDQSISIEPTR